MTAPNPGEPVYGLYIEEYTPIGSSKAGRQAAGRRGRGVQHHSITTKTTLLHTARSDAAAGPRAGGEGGRGGSESVSSVNKSVSQSEGLGGGMGGCQPGSSERTIR